MPIYSTVLHEGKLLIALITDVFCYGDACYAHLVATDKQQTIARTWNEAHRVRYPLAPLLHAHPGPCAPLHLRKGRRAAPSFKTLNNSDTKARNASRCVIHSLPATLVVVCAIDELVAASARFAVHASMPREAHHFFCASQKQCEEVLAVQGASGAAF